MSSGLGPLGALPTAPRLARAFAVLTVGSWGIGAIAELAELIVSELATNVVRAGSGPDGRPRYDTHGRLPVLWLRLMSDLAWLRIEVWDNIPTARGTPAARRAAPDEESGRGLGLVAALSHDWGWDAVPGNQAKRVWAVLPIPLSRALRAIGQQDRDPSRAPQLAAPPGTPARHGRAAQVTGHPFWHTAGPAPYPGKVFSIRVNRPQSTAGRCWNAIQDVLSLAPLALVALKLAGVITWSWWWVLSPVWISGIVVMVLVLGVCALLIGLRWHARFWVDQLDGSRTWGELAKARRP